MRARKAKPGAIMRAPAEFMPITFRVPTLARVHAQGSDEPVEVRRVWKATLTPLGTILHDYDDSVLATAPRSATIIYSPEPHR